MVTLQLQYRCVAPLASRVAFTRRDVHLIAPLTRVHVRIVRQECRKHQGGQGGQIWPVQSVPKSRAARVGARRWTSGDCKGTGLGYKTYSPRHPLSPSAPRRSELCARALGSRVLLSLHTQTKVQLVHIRLSLTRRGRNTRDTSAHVSTCSCLIRQVPTCHIRQVRNLPY